MTEGMYFTTEYLLFTVRKVCRLTSTPSASRQAEWIKQKEISIHEGRNVKRIREILGIKQDTLALELGLSQHAVSALKQKEVLDKDVIEKSAKC
jgi:DNA-binding XRE family transcriptional regulator